MRLERSVFVNILMMSKLFAQSGVGTHIRDLSRQMVEMGHTVHLMSATNDWGDFCNDNGIKFQKIDFSLHPVRLLKNIIYIYGEKFRRRGSLSSQNLRFIYADSFENYGNSIRMVKSSG